LVKALPTLTGPVPRPGGLGMPVEMVGLPVEG
jgi:hypothetical protein